MPFGLFEMTSEALFSVSALRDEASLAFQSQACGALSGLKRLLHHVLPLVVGDFLGPGRDSQCRQIDGRHGPFHQLNVICEQTGKYIDPTLVNVSILIR